MTSHVFTEDQDTMEWYIDGIPVAELKRRYEAYEELSKLANQSAPSGPEVMTWTRQDEIVWQKGFEECQREMRQFIKTPLEIYMQGKVRNG